MSTARTEENQANEMYVTKQTAGTVCEERATSWQNMTCSVFSASFIHCNPYFMRHALAMPNQIQLSWAMAWYIFNWIGFFGELKGEKYRNWQFSHFNNIA